MSPHPRGGYRLHDGTRVPGVTTIIGRFKESGALMFWACEQGKAIERGEISNLYDKRDAAAEAGTLAHSLVEAFIKGLPLPSLPDTEVGKQAYQGYENYIRWQEDNRIVIAYQEQELVSEKHKYGGCYDAIGKDSRGNFCLLDWKTSNSVYLDFLLQISAYMMLWDENYPDIPLTGGYHLLRFSKDNADFAHHSWADLEDAKKMFLLLNEAYKLDKVLKKRV